jgi:hypothetical protein
MDSRLIIDKFGENYIANEQTYKMGIDYRFTTNIAKRFENKTVLETCTGAGFSTISLARVAKLVITFEIDKNHQLQAKKNLEKAGLTKRVIFKLGDILENKLTNDQPSIEAAFLDPDWAISGPNHIFKFKNSNTKPPADILFENVFEITENIALILPPSIDLNELKSLPEHELQSLYLGDSHELYCLYFGDLAQSSRETELRIII